MRERLERRVLQRHDEYAIAFHDPAAVPARGVRERRLITDGRDYRSNRLSLRCQQRDCEEQAHVGTLSGD